jgi:hypothetical protein
LILALSLNEIKGKISNSSINGFIQHISDWKHKLLVSGIISMLMMSQR